MSDTTTDEAAPEAEATPAVQTPAEPAALPPARADDALKTRVLLPLLVPVLAMAAVAFYALNVSRVFLSGNKDAALVLGIVITVSILVGATILAALPRLRTSSLAVVVSLALLVVIGAGSVTLGPSLTHEGAAKKPLGPAVATVSITAGPGLTFEGQKNTLNIAVPKSGVIDIKYGGDTGHTLAFTDPTLSSFLLGTDAGTKHEDKVELKPGTYTFYCTVPTHREAGMQGTLTVAG